VTQAKLKTSSGSVSATIEGEGLTSRTLPGGEYGFYPRLKVPSSDGNVYLKYGGSLTSYTTNISFRHAEEYGSATFYAWQRYVTSSGEVFWIFLLRDRDTGEILGGYQAPDHPCFGNGNDPILVPHPFPDYNPEKHEIIVINPTPEQLREMKALCRPQQMGQPKRDLLELFHGWREGDKEVGPLYEPDDAVELEYPKKEITVGIVEDDTEKPLWLREEGKIIKVRIDKYQPDFVKIRPIKKVKTSILR